MYKSNVGSDEQVSIIVTKDGESLTVIAEKNTENEWQLYVANKYNIISMWNENYSSSQAAIDEGIKAIEEEGVEPFLDVEGFEYLFYE